MEKQEIPLTLKAYMLVDAASLGPTETKQALRDAKMLNKVENGTYKVSYKHMKKAVLKFKQQPEGPSRLVIDADSSFNNRTDVKSKSHFLSRHHLAPGYRRP